MPSLDRLLEKAADFEDGNIDLDEFEDWFRANFRGAYQGPGKLLSEIAVAIEGVFSRYHFEGASEDCIREELAEAIRPFVHEVRVYGVYAPPIEIVSGNPSQKTAAFRPLVLRLDFGA